MAIQQCKWEQRKTAACSEDVLVKGSGLDLALRWFGIPVGGVVELAGRFARGKNAGKCRGWIVYMRCEAGGWSFPLGGVVRPGMIFAIFCKSYNDYCGDLYLATDKFIAAATRVDSQYGHDPIAARKAAEAPEVSAQDADVRRIDAFRDTFTALLEDVAFEACDETKRWEMINRAVREVRSGKSESLAMAEIVGEYLTGKAVAK